MLDFALFLTIRSQFFCYLVFTFYLSLELVNFLASNSFICEIRQHQNCESLMWILAQLRTINKGVIKMDKKKPNQNSKENSGKKSNWTCTKFQIQCKTPEYRIKLLPKIRKKNRELGHGLPAVGLNRNNMYLRWLKSINETLYDNMTRIYN